jgi:hypothetical protein
MSFVPEFAPDASSQWRELDPEAQERALDAIEALLANPPPPPVIALYHDVYWADDHAEHYLFIRVIIDRAQERMTVAGVAHHARPKPA